MLSPKTDHFIALSFQAYVNAVNSGSKNIEKILLSPESKLQLVPLGPKLIKQTVNKHKTVDTEDTELKCIRQSDGTLVTEKKKTTEHEDILDQDLPDGDNQSSGSREKTLKHKVSFEGYSGRKVLADHVISYFNQFISLQKSNH